jgi:hypothetical protein
MDDFVNDIQERHGLFANVPRFLRRAIKNRIALLEADPNGFEREAVMNQARLKRLYALLHLKPGECGRTLFGKPAPDSPRAALREIAIAKDPGAAAILVRRHRLPYLQVEAALGTISEPVAVALVETMGDQELLVRLPLLARRGLVQGETRGVLLRRLQEMARTPGSGFSYQAAESIARRSNLEPAVARALYAIVAAGSSAQRLTGHTAILVDISSSMQRSGGCLELASDLAWRIDQVLEESAELAVYQFDSEASPIPAGRRWGADQWRRLLTIPALPVPGTSVGSALERLIADRRAVSRVLIVTDGFENRPPRLVSSLERYFASMGVRPFVHLIQPAGSGRQLATDLRNAQVLFSVFNVDQDQLGLDAVVTSLLSGTARDRVAEILATD